MLANIGDSRTYLLRDGRLRRLTRDDSFVQELIDAGHVDEREALRHPQRSLVLESLDGGPARRARVATLPAQRGDRLLLCSDGLTDVVDEASVAGVLATGSREACAERLVELALRAGGRDNVTVIVADVVERPDARAGWRG